MKRSDTIRKHFKLGLLGMGVMVMVTGCTSSPSTVTSESRNSGFMSLWNTYADCKSTSDLGQAESDLKQLRSVRVQEPGVYEGFVLPLPARIERLVSNPASRVAVDVEAMVSACALHAGELALDQGHIDVARDLFVSVITLYDGENSYYVLKARTLLGRLGQGVNVSFNAR
ncbi:MAG: hypothetical protein OEY77_06370 [Nitrospira sp.]|nr:hypothetical protein [Nitrospira sp.]